MNYQPATAQPLAGRPRGVTGAAISMVISGAVSFVCAVIWMAAGLSAMRDDVQTAGPLGASGVFAYVIVMSPVISVFLAPATIIGGVQMLRRSNRRLSVLGAVLAIVPLSSCCFLIGVPFGIWALMVLRRPDVLAWYRGVPQPPGPVGYPPDSYPQDLYRY